MGAPGKEAIIDFLTTVQPVLILMDEVLEYATKAATVRVEASNLASQTIAFIKDLTEAASNLDKVCLSITLPSSIIEHYDENAERLYQQLQKVTGRVEKIYTPVQDNEVAKVIRRRLFSQIDESAMKRVVDGFMDYAEKEGLIPAGMQPSQYRERFLDSYPFMPEVVDILYHRWGSFPTFQRTRGVLRLLSLVIYSLKSSNRPYISLGDIDLRNQEIRQEFIKHIGVEYNTVIAADITATDAGSKKVDDSLGNAYQGLSLGTRTARTIFLYSFSGGREKGATIADIKRSATTTENPASVVAGAVEEFKGRLFYLQSSADKYYFSNQPNLNRIRLTKMENIKESEITEVEKELLKEGMKGSKLKVFIWEEDPANIPDTEEHKLIVLKKKGLEVMENIQKTKGVSPRVNRNTIFFLYPLEVERAVFANTLRLKLACEAIENDKTLNLSEEQKRENKKELKASTERVSESIRRLYRMIAVPAKDGFNEIDLGIPTYGETKSLHEEVYGKLRSEGEVLEMIAPLVLREKYLTNREYIFTEQLYQSLFRTPGEARPVTKEVLAQSIAEGVRQGIFGLGELEDGRPYCRLFKEASSPAFVGQEVLIAEAVCKMQKEADGPKKPSPEYEPIVERPSIKEPPEEPYGRPAMDKRNEVSLRFNLPKGKVSNIMGVMNFLQSRFSSLEVELTARDGDITQQEYEDKIKEAFRQLGIEIEEG